MYWIYDLPIWLFGLLTTFVFMGFSILGLLFFRARIKRFFKIKGSHNDEVSYYLSNIGIFYGITVGLITVATWENYDKCEDLVKVEAASIGPLSRDFSGFSDSTRDALRSTLRTYTQYVIEKSWPQQKKGIPSKEEDIVVNILEKQLSDIYPSNKKEEIYLSKTLNAFNNFLDARRQRINSINDGLPASMWWTLILCAFVSIIVSYFLYIDDIRLHVALTASLSLVIGLLIFLIASMDNPFKGDFSVDSEPYQAILQSMKVQDHIIK
jgi:Protein of unknown function (DUF4239)